jgi:hypothetical protein
LTYQIINLSIGSLLDLLDTKEPENLFTSLDFILLWLKLSEVGLEVVDVPRVLLEVDWKVEIPWNSL